MSTRRKWIIPALFLLLTGLLVGYVWLNQYLGQRETERRARAWDERSKPRARFLQQIWRSAGEEAGFRDPRRVRRELNRLLAAGNPYGREYAVVTLDTDTYVLEVPKDSSDSSEQVCILFPNGDVQVEYTTHPSELLRRLLDSLESTPPTTTTPPARRR